jgi:hypothetical protein
MTQCYSDRTLLEAAILDKDAKRAQKYFDLVLAAEGPGPKSAMMRYNEARILFLRNKVQLAVAALAQMRSLDASPFSYILSIKALLEFQVDKTLATALCAELGTILSTYRPQEEDDLPLDYYQLQLQELQREVYG